MIRKFSLRNAKGEYYPLYNVNALSSYGVLINPEGLGYTMDTSYTKVGSSWISNYVRDAQGEISAEVIFPCVDLDGTTLSPYVVEQTFIRFIRTAGSLILVYETDAGTKYKDVDLTGYEKSEISREGYLSIKVTFTATSLWYDASALKFNPKMGETGYELVYDYNFGDINCTGNEAVYDTTETYAVGDIVKRVVNDTDEYYVCNTAIVTPEAWDSSKWTQTYPSPIFNDYVSGGVSIYNYGSIDAPFTMRIHGVITDPVVVLKDPDGNEVYSVAITGQAGSGESIIYSSLDDDAYCFAGSDANVDAFLNRSDHTISTGLTNLVSGFSISRANFFKVPVGDYSFEFSATGSITELIEISIYQQYRAV